MRLVALSRHHRPKIGATSDQIGSDVVFMRKFRAFRREATELQYRFRHLGLIGRFAWQNAPHGDDTDYGRSVHRLIYLPGPAEHRLRIKRKRSTVTVNIGTSEARSCADHASESDSKSRSFGNFGKKDSASLMLVQRFLRSLHFGFTDRQTIHSVDQMRTVGVASISDLRTCSKRYRKRQLCV